MILARKDSWMNWAALSLVLHIAIVSITLWMSPSKDPNLPGQKKHELDSRSVSIRMTSPKTAFSNPQNITPSQTMLPSSDDPTAATPSKVDTKSVQTSSPMPSYLSLLPSSKPLDEANRARGGFDGQGSQDDRNDKPYAEIGPGNLQPHQHREVGIFIDSIQVPLAIRIKDSAPKKSQLHLLLKRPHLRLVSLSGDPYLRAEIYRQLESGEAVENFVKIMESLQRDELFVTVNLLTSGSVKAPDVNYRSNFSKERLVIDVHHIYLIDTRQFPIDDKYARRGREISKQRGWELTQSLAFRQVVRNKDFLIAR